MKSISIPTWLYVPMKALLLAGFTLPFILWAMQLKGLSRDAEAEMASRAEVEIETLEKQGITHLTSSKQTPAAREKADTTAADAQTVMGIDVSHYQGNVDWNKVAKAGVRFAFAKATSGDSFVDPHFALNWQRIREAEIHRGAYHFFLAGDDPKEQARHFVRTVGKLRSKDLPPMLDVETGDGADINTLQERALVWLQEVEKHTGRRPIVYTDNGFADKVLTDPRFSRYPFWIADYAGKASNVPIPWEKGGWQFWQFEETGTVAGIEGDVDLDKFKGNVADLISFIDRSYVK